MSNFITNEMIHMLVTRGFNIVDRADIDRIRQEQQLQYSGEVDDNTAVNLGRFIGADLVVTGSVSSIGSLQRLLVKVIETETTIIRGSAAVTLSDAPPTQPSTGRGNVSRVTINPSTISVNRGESQQFVVFAGGGSTQLSGDNPHSFDSTFGVNVGIALDISGQPSPMVWEIGARYLTKGAKYEQAFTGVTATQHEYFDFLDIFAKVKLDLPVGANNAIQPFAGYAASMLASAKESFEFDGYKTDLNISKHCNSLSHSLLLGADLVFSDRFLVGMEYNYGLTDIFKQNKYSLNTMSMHIGVKF